MRAGYWWTHPTDDTPPDRLRRLTGQAAAAAEALQAASPERQRELLIALLHRVILQADAIHLAIKRSGLAGLLAEPEGGATEHREGLVDLVIPIRLRRRGVEAKLVLQAPGDRSAKPDATLVRLLGEAHRWIDDLAHGRAASVRDLARRHGRDAGEVSRTLPLAFLAPDIVGAILAGRQPIALTPRQLKRIGALPSRWDEQRRRLGFQP